MQTDSATDVLLPILIGIVAIAFFVGVTWLFKARGRAILTKWAEANGLQILDCKHRYLFFTGPFKWWTNSRNQIIYCLKVRDRDGRERSCWARCGSFWGGVFFSDQVEVRWTETS